MSLPESPAVIALRGKAGRLYRELDDCQDKLPTLAAAVGAARALVKERAVLAAIEPGEESTRLHQEARDLLIRAVEAEALAAQQSEALAVAHQRVRAELTAAVEAAARDDERVVREHMTAPDQVASDNAALLEAIDALFLRCRLSGMHGSVQHMVGHVLQMKLDGSALMARSTERFKRILAQKKAVSRDG